MGSPLGPLMANTFMCAIEEKLESEDKLPSFYKRYVDDTLAAVKDIPTATAFLSTLNEAHPAISFTMEVANNNKLPFIGMELIKIGKQLKTDLFAEECETLRGIFLKLKYPEKLVNSTITPFTESRSQQQVRDVQANAPVRIILPFKDQRSADVVRRQLSDLGKKINSDLRPVFTSKKIADDINVAEAKPPLINQQCVVYKFKCVSCDADYVGYTRRHLFQRIDEHKHSAIGNHLRDAHNQSNKDLNKQFTILKKCRGKFECLIFEMLFIQELKPKLNTQSDSIKAKLFSS
ncbi:hypothetical protein ACROYT_G000191 [Oculina patagonica]